MAYMVISRVDVYEYIVEATIVTNESVSYINMIFIALMNAAGMLNRPNGKTGHSYFPHIALKAVLDMRFLTNPLLVIPTSWMNG